MSPSTPPPLSPTDARKLVRDRGVWERGEALFRRGAVAHPERRGQRLLASIAGSAPEPYAVGLAPPLPGKRRWTWHCTCPYFEIYGGPCKHNAALLLQWAERPTSFASERSLDEQVAGPERARWLELIRRTLRDSPRLRRLLEIEPEPKRPLGRALPLAPYEEQLWYARQRYASQPEKQAQLIGGILETAAGYLRVEDPNNAARLALLLADTLLGLPERSGQLHTLLLDTLTLLEAAQLDATGGAPERGGWLQQVMGWWEETEQVEVADRLLDLLLHGYRGDELPVLERWLRALLRKPVQGNRQSNSHWRQRVRAFLLALYRTHGRTDALLDLCWEEGEDALAARVLAQQGDVAEARRLAAQGLRTPNAHREVAAALLQAGQPEAAQEVAEAGLRYTAPGRGALLAWLAARALERGCDSDALSLAQQAWDRRPNVERYALLREAARRAESWHTLQRDLHAALEHAGNHALLVEILAEEERWRDAAALLPATGPRREALTEEVARGMAPGTPDEALELLFELAELRVEGGNRPAYARAGHALLAARTLAEARGLADRFAARLHTFRAAHARRPALLDEIARALET